MGGQRTIKKNKKHFCLILFSRFLQFDLGRILFFWRVPVWEGEARRESRNAKAETSCAEGPPSSAYLCLLLPSLPLSGYPRSRRQLPSPPPRRSSFLLFCFELESKPPGKRERERERERESQITEASEESSHAPQCTLNPNPKTRGIGDEQGDQISNFVYKLSPITGHRVPTLGRWPVTANNQSPGK